jgi:hypothetical protein
VHRRAHPGAGKKSIDVVGILAQAPIRFAHCVVGQRKDLVALLGVLVRRVAAGEKTVVGIKSGVEQVKPIQFLKNQRVEQIRRGLRIARVRRAELLKVRNGRGEIQIEIAIVGSAHLRVVVHRIGVHLGRRAMRQQKPQDSPCPATRAELSQIRFHGSNSNLNCRRRRAPFPASSIISLILDVLRCGGATQSTMPDPTMR